MFLRNVLQHIRKRVGIQCRNSLVIHTPDVLDFTLSGLVDGVIEEHTHEVRHLHLLRSVQPLGTSRHRFAGIRFGQDGTIHLVLVNHQPTKPYIVDLWLVEINALQLHRLQNFVSKVIHRRVARDADDLLSQALRFQQSRFRCRDEPHAQFTHHRHHCRVTLTLPDASLHQVRHDAVNLAVHISGVGIHRCIESDQPHIHTQRIKQADGIGIIEG